jgi:hypothetical protein
MAFLVAEVAMVSNFLLHHVRGRYPGERCSEVMFALSYTKSVC